MKKFLVRITVVGVAIYFLLSFVVAQLFGINIFNNIYIVLFELITVLYTYSEGKYHCRFIKHTALSVFIADTITRLDFNFNIMPVTLSNVIPITILAIGLGTSLFKAIKHFHKVNKLKRQRNENYTTITNKENGISSS
jgi:hypothetical protein